MKHSCNNCIFLKKQHWNMINPVFYSCEKGLSYAKHMFKKHCDTFEPTLRASNTDFLKELYSHYISDFKLNKQNHHWRIVDDSRRYKRVSGNNQFYLAFETEEELDKFYSKYKDLIINSDIKLDNTYLK